MVLQLLRARLAALARKYRVPGAQLAVHQAGATVTIEVGELEHRAGIGLGVISPGIEEVHLTVLFPTGTSGIEAGLLPF